MPNTAHAHTAHVLRGATNTATQLVALRRSPNGPFSVRPRETAPRTVQILSKRIQTDRFQSDPETRLRGKSHLYTNGQRETVFGENQMHDRARAHWHTPQETILLHFQFPYVESWNITWRPCTPFFTILGAAHLTCTRGALLGRTHSDFFIFSFRPQNPGISPGDHARRFFFTIPGSRAPHLHARALAHSSGDHGERLVNVFFSGRPLVIWWR